MIFQRVYFGGKEWVSFFQLKFSSTELSKLVPNITNVILLLSFGSQLSMRLSLICYV